MEGHEYVDVTYASYELFRLFVETTYIVTLKTGSILTETVTAEA